MNIVIEKCIGSFDINIDQEFTEEMESAINKIDGVEHVFNTMDARYMRNVYIGKAFDSEQVLLNIQAEIIKYSK